MNHLICEYDSEIIDNSGKKEKIYLDKNSSKTINEIINNLDELLVSTLPEETYLINEVGYKGYNKRY